MIRVKRHAVDRYVERVLHLNQRQASPGVVSFADSQIREAARAPDMKYQAEELPEDGLSDIPIHIKNGCAVPVLVDGDTILIPTSYSEETFSDRFRTSTNLSEINTDGTPRLSG